MQAQAQVQAQSKPKSPARFIAEKFWEYQGKPDYLKKAAKDWVPRFETLLRSYPDLSGMLDYLFTVNDFWPDKLVRHSSDPLDYLEAKLAAGESRGTIRGAWIDYKAKHAKSRFSAPAAANPPVADVPRLAGKFVGRTGKEYALWVWDTDEYSHRYVDPDGHPLGLCEEIDAGLPPHPDNESGWMVRDMSAYLEHHPWPHTKAE